MKPLGVTINGIPFDHMLYHFVLCYSNWEAGTICFSESYENLSAGLQNALWKLGGVPKYHRTDNLTSAVNRVGNPEVFTANYQGLAKHYGFESHKIQPGWPNENGDIEKRHDQPKKTVDQALSLLVVWPLQYDNRNHLHLGYRQRLKWYAHTQGRNSTRSKREEYRRQRQDRDG